MGDFKDQFLTITAAIVFTIFILFVSSVIFFLLSGLHSTELSDQKGWRNFRKPWVGISIISIVLLGIILVILILTGAA